MALPDTLVAQGNPDLKCFGALVLLRFLPASLLVPLLAAMLVLTTPVGTGEGIHQDDLLHPIFPHAHHIDGRIVSDQQLAAAQAVAAADRVPSRPPDGPALGAGNGADEAGLGLGLVPTLPLVGLALVAAPEGRLTLVESTAPAEFREPPQDPPPNLFG